MHPVKALLKLLNQPDHDGFMDRHIILVPMDLIPHFEDRQKPDEGVVTFDAILSNAYELHISGCVQYTLNDSARSSYAVFYNELAKRARTMPDAFLDDIKGATMQALVCENLNMEWSVSCTVSSATFWMLL